MAPVSLRLTDELLEGLDDLVAAGRYETRSAALQHALERLLAEERRREVDRAIVAGYTRTPAEPPDELTRSLAQRSVTQEPW